MATRRILFFSVDPCTNPTLEDKLEFYKDVAAIRRGDNGPFVLPPGVTPRVVEVDWDTVAPDAIDAGGEPQRNVLE